MRDLGRPDLVADPTARRVVKEEVVAVEFAAAAGVVVSSVGENRYVAGDALVTGSNGDRWCVSRERFDARYDPCPGTPAGSAGPYRSLPVTVLAKRIDEPFRIERAAGGDVLGGQAGDWVVQYAPGDYGIVDRARFERVYRALDGAGCRRAIPVTAGK